MRNTLNVNFPAMTRLSSQWRKSIKPGGGHFKLNYSVAEAQPTISYDIGLFDNTACCSVRVLKLASLNKAAAAAVCRC